MPPVARGDVLEVEISGLATGGRGLAKLDRFVLFVEGALPGDRVKAKVVRSKGRYAEAVTVERLAAGPRRVDARCSHLAVCGGCRFQDYAYDAQLEHKTALVGESLQHIGGLDVPIRGIIPAPETFRYRNKMEFSFGTEFVRPPGAERDEAEGEPVSLDEVLTVGLHHRGFYDRTFNLKNCHLAPEPMNRAVEVLRECARRDGVPAYDLKTHDGVLRFVALRSSRATGALLVNLVAAQPLTDIFGAWAVELSKKVPELGGFVFSLHRERAQAVQAEMWQVLWGEERIVEKLNGLEFEISPWSFFQTNSQQAERLYTEALAAGEVRMGDRVLDLYCGTGTLTLTFARECSEAWGVETVGEAILDARRNAERNELDRSTKFFEGDARRWLREGGPKDLKPTVVVVDPPRAGLHPRVIDRVCELEPRKVVYVSCNPTTLARDLAHFARLGYTAPWIQPVDMFPHTEHVECVAGLVRG